MSVWSNNVHILATSHYLFTNTESNKKLRSEGCHLFKSAGGRDSFTVRSGFLGACPVTPRKPPVSLDNPFQLLDQSHRARYFLTEGIFPHTSIEVSHVVSCDDCLLSFQCAPLRRFYFHFLCNLTFEVIEMQSDSPLDFSPAKPSWAPLPFPWLQPSNLLSSSLLGSLHLLTSLLCWAVQEEKPDTVLQTLPVGTQTTSLCLVAKLFLV